MRLDFWKFKCKAHDVETCLGRDLGVFFVFAMKLYGSTFFFFFRTWDRDFEMSRPFCIIFGLGSSVGTSS